VQGAAAEADRVMEILETEPAIKDRPHAVEAEMRGAIRYEHVTFGYEKDRPVLHDVSFEAQPGDTVAIVGPTGAGKTTLVNLLMRFYEIDHGTICVDGIDTRDLTRDELRRTFGMVLQDTWLFHGTIRENIAYGRENASEDE